ncbi:nitrogen fixation protein NifZ [Mesorhizobium argentiipisi]|uniref:Nitrogen fixation protein NifZ n=1 Tax=Mesorhizobium argentiipisi TaxID=3015175 RepID=A0ABU8K869_9HYPH
MTLWREQEVEIHKPPGFMPGERVRATRHVKNDGTYPGKEIGENLVRTGDEGYVRDIGTFLQQFYIYAVEWIGRGTVVGMRAREMVSLDRSCTPSDSEMNAAADKQAAT